MKLKIKITEENKYQDMINYLDKLNFIWISGKKLLDHVPEKTPRWIVITIYNKYRYVSYSSFEEFKSPEVYEISIIEEVNSILCEFNDICISLKEKFPFLSNVDISDMAISFLTNKLFINSNIILDSYIEENFRRCLESNTHAEVLNFGPRPVEENNEVF